MFILGKGVWVYKGKFLSPMAPHPAVLGSAMRVLMEMQNLVCAAPCWVHERKLPQYVDLTECLHTNVIILKAAGVYVYEQCV